MENLGKRGHLRSEHGRDDYSKLSMLDLHNIDIGEGNMRFKNVSFPLKYDQRYHLFRQIAWNYNYLFIKEEDFKRVSQPKKVCTVLAGIWGLGFLGLQQMYTSNPEVFYRRFLFTPAAPLFFEGFPVALGLSYFHFSKRAYTDLYNKYVGHYTDEELLALDAKFNPKKQIVYDYMLKKHRDSEAKEE